MKSEYNIFPLEQHLNSVLDALCHAGRLEETEKLAELFPSQSIVTWKTILGGCRIHCDLERLERFAKRALELDPNDGSIYVLVCNTYNSLRKRDDAERWKVKMKTNNVKRISGITTGTFNGDSHI